MANFAFARLGTLVVAVADARPPLDEEWARYLALSADGDGQTRTVFFTDGGSPNALQRRAAAQQRRGRAIATAMVSDSAVFHSLQEMLSFINPGIRVFTSVHWPEAAAFVHIAEAERPAVLALAARLSLEIGEVKVLRALGV